MNKARRIALTDLATRLKSLQAELGTLRDEEQDYYDNMPESFQGSGKGDAANVSAYELGEACESIEEAVNSINEAVEG